MKRRLPKILLALVLGLAFVEGSLWLAHALFGAADRASGAGAEALCIGDSHTYGWNVDAPAAWPARLADLSGLTVANRAAPGKNTQTLLEELDEYLALDSPRLVLIQAGLNNPWSRPHQTSPSSPLAWSRTAKLVRILMGRFSSQDDGGRRHGATELAALGDDERPTSEQFVEVEGEDGFTEVRVLTREGDYESFVVGGGSISEDELGLAYEWIQRDLVELCERVTAAGGTPVLVTYALETGEYLPNVNFIVREAAVEADVALVDVAAALAPRLGEFDSERLFFHDAHPRREGYAVVARAVHDGLVAAGLLERAPLGDPFAVLEAPAPQPVLEARAEPGGGWTLELAYEAGLSWSVLLSRGAAPEGGEAPGWLGLGLPLEAGALLEASQRAEALRGAFDGSGRASLQLDPELLAGLGVAEGSLQAALVVRTRDWAGIAVGAPVVLR